MLPPRRIRQGAPLYGKIMYETFLYEKKKLDITDGRSYESGSFLETIRIGNFKKIRKPPFRGCHQDWEDPRLSLNPQFQLRS